MRLFRDRFRSRKVMKRALGMGHNTGEGRTYRDRVQTTSDGRRFVKSGVKRYQLSQMSR